MAGTPLSKDRKNYALNKDIGYKEFAIIWVQMCLFFVAYLDLNLLNQFELKDSDIK